MPDSDDTTTDWLGRAARLADAGHIAEAESIYRGVLAQQPGNAMALHLLGMLVGQRGDHAEAIALLSRAAAAAPSVAEHHNVLGEMQRRMGRLHEAIASLSRAVELASGLPDAHNNLGNALREAGRLDDAIAAYRRAVALRPDYADAFSNLGNALRASKQLEASLAAQHEAVRLAPASAAAHNHLGICLVDAGRFVEAITEYTSAIELNPKFGEAFNNLGNALRALARNTEAISAYRRALQLMPESADAFANLGGVLRAEGRLDEAMACHARALELNPNHAEAYGGVGGVLADQGRLDEALDAFRTAIRIEPDNSARYSPLLYTLHFHPGYDARQILAEHRNWARQFADPLAAHVSGHSNDRSPDRRLRVGYVSPNFRRHPVGRFLVPLFEHHDKDQFEIFCYSGVRRGDDLTDRLRRRADHWRNTIGLSDPALAEQIRRDGIDVLVDLTMHMTDSRLIAFARRPAPVQVTWLAYVGTTGLTSIDYRLSDPYLDPPPACGAEYSEQTWRLNRCYWCYEPTDPAPEVGLLPALQAGCVTFGCLNNHCKVTAPVVQTWVELMHAVPKSRLVLHGNPGSYQQDMYRRFSDAGIAPERLRFVPFQPVTDYLRTYQQIDIGLDPFPYGGGTTTCDSLWMGVPVVSLAGQTAVGRCGVSLLNNVGLTGLIAATQERYVSIGAEWARALDELARVRAGLGERMRASPLMDAPGFTADVEASFREMWKRWCAR